MLTGRQQEIWKFLTDYVDEHGYPPTVREIGEAVGLASPSTVHAHLANLERAGLIKRDPTKPRALELRRELRPEPARAADVHRLPLVGEIAAGVENPLRGFPDGELIAEPFGHRPVRLHCAVQRNRSAILATHDDIGSRDRGVYVAPRRDSR